MSQVLVPFHLLLGDLDIVGKAVALKGPQALVCANRSALPPFDISTVDLDGNLVKACAGPVKVRTNSDFVELSGTISRTIKGGKTVFDRVMVNRLTEVGVNPVELQIEGVKKLAALKPVTANLSIESSEAPASLVVTTPVLTYMMMMML